MVAIAGLGGLGIALLATSDPPASGGLDARASAPAPVLASTPAEPAGTETPAGTTPPATEAPSPTPTASATAAAIDSPSPAPPPAAEPPSTQSRERYWLGVLDTLDLARVAAFHAADESLLSRVYTDGSSARAEEVRAIRSLNMIDGHIEGGRQVMESVEVLGESPTLAVLHFTSHVTAYSVVDSTGGVISRHGATPSLVQEVTLVNTAAGWRISQISPV